jgi:DNA-directed RNA polymerase specialized sigma24 family protein
MSGAGLGDLYNDGLGLRHREIAVRLGVPVGNSKSRLCAARSGLREALGRGTR